jgi:hypothetical protein
MLEQIAWGFCKIAFDAAQDECFPEPMRRGFRRLGTMWFWLAVLLEGRALAAICERRASRWLALTAALASLRQRCLKALPLAKADKVDAAVVDLPLVAAWSLPNLPQLQRLGLGQVWAVRCPFCRDFHTHVPGEGLRQAACAAGTQADGYRLTYAGHLPRLLHDAFQRSVHQTWPKLLLEWPQHDSMPALLQAA